MSVLVRKLDVCAIQRDATAIVLGPKCSGKTGIVISIAIELKFQNICVITNGDRHRYATFFGQDHVHAFSDDQTELARHVRDSDCLILEDLVCDMDAHQHLNLARGKFCVLVTREIRYIRPEDRAGAGIVIITNKLREGNRTSAFHAWPIANFDETRWTSLLTTVTLAPDEPYRGLVLNRTHRDGARLAWYRAPWPPALATTSSSETETDVKSSVKKQIRFLPRTRFPPGQRAPLLPVALLSHVALMLRVRDAMRLYATSTTVYRHGAAHLRRLPEYECRTHHPGNITIAKMRPTPVYACP